MMPNEKKSDGYEIINITRRTFPKNAPIAIPSESDYKIILRPGEVAEWKTDDIKTYFLRNAHWFKKLVIHFTKPEVD